MSNPQVKTMVFSRAYTLGDPMVFDQYGPYPFDLYAVRKQLEKYNLNKYEIEFVKVKFDGNGRNHYSVGFPMKQFNVDTQEEIFAILGKEIGTEPTLEAVAAKISKILNDHYLTK